MLNFFSQENSILFMGVMNITPNSFSDGGHIQNHNDFRKVFEGYQKVFDIIDIGAESTAPHQNQITLEEEIARWDQYVFEDLASVTLDPVIVSIDSYRPSLIDSIYIKLKKKFPGAKLLWNDVSGIFDTQTQDILNKYPDLYYVLGHTQVKKKEDTWKHATLNTPHIIEEIEKHFSDFQNKYPEFLSRVIFDPCFGFSKSRSENLELLKNMESIIQKIPGIWMLGISRKSFLRESHDKIMESEFLHTLILQRWSNLSSPIIFRLHDPHIMSALKTYKDLFCD